MPYAQVAFPLPLRRTFTYRVPEHLAGRVKPGGQVQVPFRDRPRRGFVVALSRDTSVEAVQDIAAVLEEQVLSPHLLDLARWVAEYYLAPLGEVLAAAVPGGLEGFARSRARRGAQEDRAVHLALPERIVLTAEQREGVRAIEAAIARGTFSPLLLHGVTASGKTEVYMRAAHAARDGGAQTLVLVPEVALGSQAVASFRRRFGGRVGVLHSYLTMGERRRNWELAARGALDVVVGARSAVFAPLPRLGLIVVDEEHEPAFKQSEQLRYHGRDTAVRRAQLLGIPIVLGSATPSLETLANAARGKYATVRLPRRIDRRPLPKVRVVDSRREGQGSGLLSPTLKAALARRFEAHEQALLYLNRRGHSHHIQCRACGHVAECPHCDIALTLHVTTRDWRCHFCDHREPASVRCPRCQAPLLRFSSGGTQRAERELIEAFPEARVLRLDTDVARDKKRPAEVIAAFRRGEADVLVGTQMIAKGFDFPRVTLVGVLDADVALHLPDFRAAERTHQLLVQVAGRAGRGTIPGEVVVQTCTPDHPAIAAALRHDERLFIEHELAERREAGYPPFTRLIALLFTGKEAPRVERAASEVTDALRPAAEAGGIEVLGPAPHMMARLRGQFRWHTLLKGTRHLHLRDVAETGLRAFESSPERRAVRLVADVDPVEML